MHVAVAYMDECGCHVELYLTYYRDTISLNDEISSLRYGVLFESLESQGSSRRLT
jgi:hypothetical protein